MRARPGPLVDRRGDKERRARQCQQEGLNLEDRLEWVPPRPKNNDENELHGHHRHRRAPQTVAHRDPDDGNEEYVEERGFGWAGPPEDDEQGGSEGRHLEQHLGRPQWPRRPLACAPGGVNEDEGSGHQNADRIPDPEPDRVPDEVLPRHQPGDDVQGDVGDRDQTGTRHRGQEEPGDVLHTAKR